MHLWQSLKFATRALGLRSAARRSPAANERKQQSRLKELLRHARGNSSYLGHKYAAVDLDNLVLSRLPTSNKSELMAHFDDWLTVDDVKRDGVETFLGDAGNVGKLYRDKYVLSHTSGSEGQSLLLVKSPDEFGLMFALQAARGNSRTLNLREISRKLRERVRLAAVTMQPGFFPSSTAFHYAPDGARQYIDVLQLSLTDADLLSRLEEFRPTHLTAYASILHELVRHVEAGELRLAPELELVVNMAERLLPERRQHYAAVLGAPVLDDYGMGECLFLTNGCLESGGMHVNADWAILEVVDENNQPVPCGERGAKVLLTNLANRVQPFIRYEIGDVAVMATEPCCCGSNLPLISRIEGRTSNILHVGANGQTRPLHPAIIEQAVSGFHLIREFQLVQEGPDRVRVIVEPLASAEVDCAEVGAIVDARLAAHGFADSVHIEVQAVESLAVDPVKGKFKRVLAQAAPQEVATVHF